MTSQQGRQTHLAAFASAAATAFARTRRVAPRRSTAPTPHVPLRLRSYTMQPASRCVHRERACGLTLSQRSPIREEPPLRQLCSEVAPHRSSEGELRAPQRPRRMLLAGGPHPRQQPQVRAQYIRRTLRCLTMDRLVAHSPEALALLDLLDKATEDPLFTQAFSGCTKLPGSETAAHCYCGTC